LFGVYSYSGVLSGVVSVPVAEMGLDGTWDVVLTSTAHMRIINTGYFTVQRAFSASGGAVPDTGTAYVFRV